MNKIEFDPKKQVFTAYDLAKNGDRTSEMTYQWNNGVMTVIDFKMLPAVQNQT